MSRRKYLTQKDIKTLLKIDPSGILLGFVASLPIFIIGILILKEYSISWIFFLIGIILFFVPIMVKSKERKEKKRYRDKLFNSGIQSINSLSPYDFEEYIASIYEKLGYSVDVTPKSGDYGLDVIASNKNEKLGIQVKKYSSSVGVKAVQEVIAGMAYYNCNKGVVVTNSKNFTKEARNLAAVKEIELIGYDELADILLKIKNI